MEKCQFTLNCKSALHSRPLTIIHGIAESFKPHEVYIVHGQTRFAADETLNLLKRAIKDQDTIGLEVKGKYEEVVLRVMRAVFDALSDLPFEKRISELQSSSELLDSYKSSYADAAWELHDRIATILKESKIQNQHSILSDVIKSLNITEKRKVEARLNYSKGMHVFPSQILGELRCCFPETFVQLLYIRANGEMDSVDVFNTLALSGTGILDGQKVTIDASGKDSVTATRRIKYIMENMEAVVEKREKQKGRWDEWCWWHFFDNLDL